MASFTDVARASASTAMAGLTTRGLTADNTVNIAFGLASFVLGVLGILLTWQLARCGRRAREPTGTGLDDQRTGDGDVELQRLTQPGDGYELTFQLRRHA